MPGPIERTMARQIRHVRPEPPAAEAATERALAAEITRDFGAYVPPFALHASSPATLAACWTMARECLVETHVDRRRKETVASAVSRRNRCGYCVDAHTAMLQALGDAATADVLAGDAAEEARDPLVAWADASGSPGHPILAAPPFTRAEAPELVGIALAFHYINRMVAVFLVPSPLPFRSSRLKAATRRLLAPVLRGMVTRALVPGAGLRWLPDAPLPEDLAWAGGHTTIASALARAAASFERGGETALPAAVRALVRAHLQAWRGEDPGLGRAWLESAVGALDPAERPAGRAALLTARAPFQVDDAILADFRRHEPSDAALVAATAWASFAAARRIASWLAPAPGAQFSMETVNRK